MKKCLACLLLFVMILSGCEMDPIPKDAVFGFAREIPEAEQTVRLQVVHTAEQWLDCKESDGSFKPIIDLYNDHKPLAMDYAVKYTDQWCATFGSAVAIKCDFTDIIPTECGCERQIELWQSLGCWTENDYYAPQPGDYIYYNWDAAPDFKDNTGWSDHVGIVVGTAGPFIKVISSSTEHSGFSIL